VPDSDHQESAYAPNGLAVPATARGRSRSSPRPVDFPVYGLGVPWPGPRWLDLFCEAIGDPVHWVVLFHQNLDGESPARDSGPSAATWPKWSAMTVPTQAVLTKWSPARNRRRAAGLPHRGKTPIETFHPH
jgi:hypothetical protein